MNFARPTRRFRLVLLAALALAAVLLAPDQAAAQQSAPSLKIGILTDIAGPYADVGGRGSVIAAEMAAQDFGRTVLGKPIRIVSGDNQGKPDVAVAVARRWFDEEGVSAIGDLAGSPIALAVQALAADKKRIALNSTSSTELLTNEQCSRTGVHWSFDSYSVVKTLATGLAKSGTTWFMLATDNAGGHAVGRAVAAYLKASGAKLVGEAYHPANTADMSAFVLQAQASGAQYVALGNAGADLVNSMKQAHEFDLARSGQTMVAFTLFLTDLKAMGLQVADGLVYPTAFVPDGNQDAAAWSKRFFALHHAMPNDVQAGVYSSVLHYLKSVQAAGTDQADAVMAKMRELPVHDAFAANGTLREDGLMVHDMYLVQAKKPSESTGPWDLIKLVKTVPGEQAFRPLAESQCPLVRASR